MAWFKKGSDEVGKKRKENKKKPYKKCGHTRSYKGKNGSTITVICTKNANTIHIHE